MKMFLIIILLMVSGCTSDYPHRFSTGDCVQLKLTKDQGMVLTAYEHSNYLKVRLGYAGKTNTALLGPTVKYNEYLTAKTFYDFELEKCLD